MTLGHYGGRTIFQLRTKQLSLQARIVDSGKVQNCLNNCRKVLAISVTESFMLTMRARFDEDQCQICICKTGS